MCAETRRFRGLTGLPTDLMAARILTFVILIVIGHVSRIGGYSASSQRSSNVPYDTHRLAKRMDLEACLGQFDVHNNTIIRTGESQAIGGKYLQGLELDTMEECQRLCCETESCDVYIFEDKNGGYCYLFECGPPENFHCKFTRHANYTSAVLTPVKLATTTRPPPPPPPPPPVPIQNHQQNIPNLSQQERELTSLKVKPDKLAELATSIGGLNQQQQPIRTGQQMDVGIPQKGINATMQQCSRFQFLCHSGECIAVYNACDGIPQCEDGSDEGPECSGAAANNGGQSNTKGNVEAANMNSIPLENAPNPKTLYRTNEQRSQQQLQNLHQQHTLSTQTINSPIVNNREDVGAWANRKIVEEAQQTAGVNSGDLNSHIFTHKNGLQLPHNIGVGSNSNTGAIDMSAGVANYPNSNANLSPLYTANLQQNGVYLPPVVPPQQNDGMYAMPQQQILDQQGHIYVPASINWAQQQQQQQQQQVQKFPAVATPLGAANPHGSQLSQGPAYIVNSPQEAMVHYQQQEQPNSAQQTKIAFLPVPNLSQGKMQVIQPQSPDRIEFQSSIVAANDQNKVESENAKSSTKKALGKADNVAALNENGDYEDYEDQSTEAPKKKPHKHKKIKTKSSASNGAVGKELPKIEKADLTDDPVQQAMAQRKQQSQLPSPVHEQYRMIHENLAMEFRDHDGQSDRPGGAVLSLTLGVLVTAALAILIGCRMRTVGRRARRMGGKFSHEADFLVNGMYL